MRQAKKFITAILLLGAVFGQEIQSANDSAEKNPQCAKLLALSSRIKTFILSGDSAKAIVTIEELEKALGIHERRIEQDKTFSQQQHLEIQGLRATLNDMQQQNDALASQLGESEERRFRAALASSFYSRNWLEEKIFDGAARYLQGSTGIIAVMTDLDDFKKVNDKFGHQMGDKVIEIMSDHLANHLLNVVREFDRIDLIRYGGDEFLILVRVVISERDRAKERRSYAAVVRRIVSLMTDYIAKIESDRDLKALGNLTVSAGVAALFVAPKVKYGSAPIQELQSQLKKLIHTADKGLYLAKKKGKNQVVRKRGYVE